LDIDIQGTEKFVNTFPETNAIFLLPPSIASLRDRLEKRGTETAETLKTRLGNCTKEMEKGLLVDDKKGLQAQLEDDKKSGKITLVIGYRLVNDDLAKSTPAFIALLEGLYSVELEGAE
jgi:guanylate kinase